MSMLSFDVVSRLPRFVSANDLPATAKILVKTLKLRRASVVSIRCVSPSIMAKINQAHRGKRTSTDVLSFAVADEVQRMTPKGQPCELGDVIICPTYAGTEARRRGVDVREEFLRLLVHGVLHIHGHDHDTAPKEARMFALQERVVAAICSSSS